MTTSPAHRLHILVLDTPGIGPVVDDLDQAIARHTAGVGSAEVTVVASPPAAGLAAHLGARADMATVDVVIAGIGAGMPVDRDGSGEGDLRRTFGAAMVDAVAVVKDHAARMLLVNGSTVVAGLERAEARSVSLDIARLNLAALDLSVATGLSIIDADRTIAELGGAECVRGVLTYEPAACAAIRDELVRVLEDYGFFDERPLLEQVGRAARS